VAEEDIYLLAGSSLVVGVAAMVDVHDDDLVFLFVNAIADAVLASACPPQSDERRLQRSTDTLGCLAQRSQNEFPRGEGGGRRQLLTQRSARAGGQDDTVRLGIVALLGVP
jgi:hypothetical protein